MNHHRHWTTARMLQGLLLLGAVLAGRPALAGDIVDTRYVSEALGRGVLVWDVRGEADYKKGHIPGSVSIGDASRVLRDENREDPIATAEIEKILGGAGIDPSKEVIVYGGKADNSAYFALVTLRQFGSTSARVYHGGIDEWAAAGQPLSTEPSSRPAVAVKLTPAPGVTVSTEEVIGRLGKPDVQLLDVRTLKEFKGQDIRAIRGGHIPGATHIPFEQNWVDPETPKKLAERKVQTREGMGLKPLDQLKALYAQLDPNKETVVYCQSGVRSAQTATVLRELGFKDVKVYESSWLGYASRLDAPAEDVTFVNVGLLNSRIAGLQARVEMLERELAARTAAPGVR